MLQAFGRCDQWKGRLTEFATGDGSRRSNFSTAAELSDDGMDPFRGVVPVEGSIIAELL